MRVVEVMWNRTQNPMKWKEMRGKFAPHDAAWQEIERRWFSYARDVIRAMHEPTDEMVEAGTCMVNEDPRASWGWMIDAASPPIEEK